MEAAGRWSRRSFVRRNPLSAESDSRTIGCIPDVSIRLFEIGQSCVPDTLSSMASLSDHSNRLGFIKHVLGAALDHARLPEPFSSKAVLDLHDAAVELFLQLVAEHVGATLSKKADFLEYWPAIKEKLGTDLPMQPAMKRLNQARVDLKHSGIRPSRGKIDDLAAKTVGFFDESCRLIFSVPLDALSSIGLIGYEPVVSRLRRAEELAGTGDHVGAAQICALAFDEVMEIFRSKSADSDWARSPFPRLSKTTHFSVENLGYDWSRKNKDLAAHLEQNSGAFADNEPVLLMLALGIDYRQFARFKKVTPDVDGMMDGSNVVDTPRSEPSERDLVFATDFVTQAALRLRELDPNPPAGGVEHPFRSEPAFSVMLPAHGTLAAFPWSSDASLSALGRCQMYLSFPVDPFQRRSSSSDELARPLQLRSTDTSKAV